MISTAKKRVLLVLALIAFAGFGTGCSKSDDDDGSGSSKGSGSGTGTGTGSGTGSSVATGYNGDLASGKVMGTEWKFLSGKAVPSDDLDLTEPYLFSLLSDKFEYPCQELTFQAKDRRRIDFEAKLEKSEVDVESKHKFTFLDDSKDVENPEGSVAGTSGKLKIVVNNKDRISGLVKVKVSDDNEVDGVFNVKKCCLSDDENTYVTCPQ